MYRRDTEPNTDGLITLALFGNGKGFNYKSYKRSLVD